MHRFLTLIPAAALVLACQQAATEQAETTEPAVDLAAEEQAIRAFADSYEEAVAAGNTDAVIGMYTADATTAAHDGTAAPAADAVRTMMASTPPGATFTIDHETIVIASSGDLAYDAGTYTVAGTGPDGQTFTETHRYLVALEKVDGAWKLGATMDSAPVGAAAGTAEEEGAAPPAE